MEDWNAHVKRVLKAEMVKRDISGDELARRLCEIGCEETSSSVRNKLSRGTFSAAFLHQSLYVMGCDVLPVEAPFNKDVNRMVANKRINAQKIRKKNDLS